MELQDLSKDQLVSRILELEASIAKLKQTTRIDRAALIASVLGLTPVESRIVAILSGGQIMSMKALSEAVYFDDEEERPVGRSIAAHISKIRRKLFPSGVEIRTIHGVGFKMEKSDLVDAIVSSGEYAGMMPRSAIPAGDRRDKADRIVVFLSSKRNHVGRAMVSTQEIRDAVGLTGGLLQIMKRLERRGRISIIARPRPGSPRQKWVVGLMEASVE